MAGRDESGSATVLVTAAFMLAAVLGMGALIGSGYVAAAHATRGAADLIAVSAATAHGQGADACVTADRAASANKVEVVSCSVAGDAIDFVVTVEVSKRVPQALPGLPARLTTKAYAGTLSGAR